MQTPRKVHATSTPRLAIIEGSGFDDAIRGAGHTKHGEGIPVARARGTPQLAPRQNFLLTALGHEDRARLAPHLEHVCLPSGMVLCEASCPSEFVYFPTAGIVSLCHVLANGKTVEVAITGCEGIVGLAAVMGGGAATYRAEVRNGGYGYRMRAHVLEAESDRNPALRQVLMRYAQSLMAQLARSAACQGHHPLDQRLRRLLLESTDLLRTSDITLTHEAISCLLGTRRESVTSAAGKLQDAGLLRYCRGRITILDRPGLESDVCECYREAKAERARGIVQPPSDGTLVVRRMANG